MNLQFPRHSSPSVAAAGPQKYKCKSAVEVDFAFSEYSPDAASLMLQEGCERRHRRLGRGH